MKTTLFGILVVSALLALGLVGSVRGNSAVAGDEPAMMASPQTIVLAKVDTLTVHTNLPAVAVDLGTLELNGVAASSVGVDSCGHVVGKFVIAELDLAPGSTSLELTGLFRDGSAFAATDQVTVK